MLITSHHEREEEIKGSLGFGVFFIEKMFILFVLSGGYRVQTLCGSNRDFFISYLADPLFSFCSPRTYV